uniref:RING-type domain-containing protein n=1 Tax=Leersia perrieri TaxID=77586 RepID=A0A0D9W066_9ORYZ
MDQFQKRSRSSPTSTALLPNTRRLVPSRPLVCVCFSSPPLPPTPGPKQRNGPSPSAGEKGEEKRRSLSVCRCRAKPREERTIPSPASHLAACLGMQSAADVAALGGGGDVLVVKCAGVAACLTCPLCRRLLRDATTISECLHTFCRKCIHEEFDNKESCCCPTCNIDLGCAPLEKLRVDHSIQFVRSKIFPFKRKKVKDPEVMSPAASPIKRKERSLSSLTIPAPQVSIQKCLTKRRTKASCLRNLSLHSTLRGSKDASKKLGGWKPLGSQLKLGKDKKSLKSSLKDSNKTKNKTGDPDDGTPDSQAKARDHFTRYRPTAKRTGSKKLLMLKSKKKSFKAKQPSKKRRFRALWFYLLAAFDQDTNFTTATCKVFEDQKYLVQKLNLSRETEVEVLCGGKVVSQGMTLLDLADCWLEKGPKGRMRSSVGSPATGFMVTVFYRRPDVDVPSPQPPTLPSPETES